MIFTQSHVALETAMALVREVLSQAGTENLSVAVAVVDAQGSLVVAIRMDGVSPSVLDFATDKAFTAAMAGKSTVAFGARMDSIPGLRLGLGTRPRLLTWGGGLPLLKDGKCIGGIGVSGARDEEDIAAGRAALRSCRFDDVPD